MTLQNLQNPGALASLRLFLANTGLTLWSLCFAKPYTDFVHSNVLLVMKGLTDHVRVCLLAFSRPICQARQEDGGWRGLQRGEGGGWCHHPCPRRGGAHDCGHAHGEHRGERQEEGGGNTGKSYFYFNA